MRVEDLRPGEVLCKLTKKETHELKRVCVELESVDQSIRQLYVIRANLCERKTDIWEDVFDKYLLSRGKAYNVNWRTGELTKV